MAGVKYISNTAHCRRVYTKLGHSSKVLTVVTVLLIKPNLVKMSKSSLGQRADFYNFVYSHGSGGHFHNPFATVVDANGSETHESERESDEELLQSTDCNQASSCNVTYRN